MTTDVKERRIDVYPQSWEQRERWAKEARARKMPLSKLIVLLIDEAIDSSTVVSSKESIELRKQLTGLQDEMKKQKLEISRLNRMIAIQDEELEESRNRAFLEKSFTGYRELNKDLINALRGAKRPIPEEELLQGLGVTPTDPKGVKAISAQLEAMQEYGLVKCRRNGWEWVE